MFKFCDYCGDEFFAEDTRRVDGGRCVCGAWSAESKQ